VRECSFSVGTEVTGRNQNVKDLLRKRLLYTDIRDRILNYINKSCDYVKQNERTACSLI
jgi:hypothetical protein